ncbi:MAG TPA: ABC transporter permease [Acidimicrobiales bacterium]|nr:ABC transporter permease [Acidimicrobiales bacterium]
MTGYIIRRVLQAVIVVLGVTFIAFLLEHLIPGGIARSILGPRATPASIAAWNTANGYDSPLWYQYWIFLDHLLHGNLGFSYRLNRSVDSIIASDLPRDILLVGTSLVLAVIIAVPVGVMQAVKRNGAWDYAGTATAFVLYSMPSYALGLILIGVFAITIKALPPEAPQGTTVTSMLAHPSGLVLPVLTLTLINVALFSRYMRSSAVENLAQDYIRTARAKGLSERRVLRRHLLRNSLIPVATLVGLSLPAVLTAGLVLEYLFNFQGIGLEYFNAATTDDFPVMLGITVLIGFATVLGNLLADIAYAVLDPRVRY